MPVEFIAAWDQLCRDLGVAGDSATAVGADLARRHREPGRHYHGTEHIEAVLRHLGTLASATPTARLAAFFHDAIYDATRPDNERQSAALARTELGSLGVEPSVVSDVAAIIEATDGHVLGDKAPVDAAAFLDADLAILGSAPQAYEHYARAIRSEYGQMSDDDFRSGRANVLRHFLERDVLYFTSAGSERWDGPARRNLTAELAQLT